MQLSGNIQPISLYFHIPFCTRKCDYCHFFVLPDKEIFKLQYMKALKLEWEQKLSLLKDKKLISIYFGGGTPALLGPNHISTILSWIPAALTDVEVTLEANPENVTYDMMCSFAQAGINRVSLGVQSFDNALLPHLSRHHSAEKAEEAVFQTANAGIQNISIDLMYDLPTQSVASWEKSLEKAIQLPITHLSLYNLSIEPQTVFYKKKASLLPQLPSQEASFEMLERAIEVFEKSGLARYEISAFAKKDFYSKHNKGYWTGRPFLGYGPSAYSFWEGSRFRNVAHLGKYSKQLEANSSPIDFTEKLSPTAALKEHIAVRLRLLEGIDLDALPPLPSETIQTLEKANERGWLFYNKSCVALTHLGLNFHDLLAEEIIE